MKADQNGWSTSPELVRVRLSPLSNVDQIAFYELVHIHPLFSSLKALCECGPESGPTRTTGPSRPLMEHGPAVGPPLKGAQTGPGPGPKRANTKGDVIRGCTPTASRTNTFNNSRVCSGVGGIA